MGEDWISGEGFKRRWQTGKATEAKEYTGEERRNHQKVTKGKRLCVRDRHQQRKRKLVGEAEVEEGGARKQGKGRMKEGPRRRTERQNRK